MRYLIAICFLVLPNIAQGQTYNDDFALVTEINRQRILRNLSSLIVNHDLQQSARVLAQNHAYFQCDEAYETCQGESLKRRFKRFYPGYYGIGEAWALGFDVESIVAGFLDSPIHASIILGDYVEIGAALVSRDTWVGTVGEAIVDVGVRAIYPEGTPIISGAVYSGYAWLTYEAKNPPKAAFVTLGNKDYSLKLFEGKPNKGIYRVPIPWPAGCERVLFTVLSDYDTPITFPNPIWENNIGDLCFDTPPLLNKVRLKINASGNRLFKGTVTMNLETLPNQKPRSLLITYGKNSAVLIPTDLLLKQTGQSTKLRGTYRSTNVQKAEPGRVNIYLDYRLVASVSPRRTQQNYIEVGR